MKSIIKEKEKKLEENYPCLKISGNEDFYIVVLFSEPKTGVALLSNKSPILVGEYSKYWTESDFTLFTGTIELSNND